MNTNDPMNWLQRLAGQTVLTHVDEPEYGFFRVRSRDKQSWRPVAYWFDADGGLRCRLDGKDLDENRARELWAWAVKNPIEYEVYGAITRGEPWPDVHPAVTLSNNAPPDISVDALSDRIADLAREADKIKEVKTQAEADQAADLANKLNELQVAADAERAIEKKQFDEAAKAVQAKWKPIVDVADAAKRKLKAVIAIFLTAKQTAERNAREEAAKAGQEPPAETRRSTTTAGTRGRAVSLRVVKDVEIINRAAVIAYFADSDAMCEFLQALAEKAVRAGVTVPGTKITERSIAA